MAELGKPPQRPSFRARVGKRVARQAPMLSALAFGLPLAARRRLARPAGRRDGVNFAGFLSGSLGLGVSARCMARALAEQAVPAAFLDVPAGEGRDTQAPGVSGLGRRASEGLQFQAAWTAIGSTKSTAAAPTSLVGRSTLGLCFRNTSAATPPATASHVTSAGPPSSRR